MKVLLVVYDNGSHISFFPQGLAYISSVLRKQGHEVEFFLQDVNHYSDEYLTTFLNERERFDILGISVIGGYYQYRKLLSLSKAVNNSHNRPKMFIIGGHGPAPDPAYFLKKTNADIVVIGEGEDTIIEIASNKDLKEIDGIAYMKDDKLLINKRRKLIENIDNISIPDYEMFPIEYYRLIRFPGMNSTDFGMPVLSGRGCKWKCNYCFRLDKGLRIRSEESILSEIEFLQKKWNINFILFSDELLMSSEERTISLCESFKKYKPSFKWICNGRLNFAKKDVLQIMKESGCVKINYGIESMDDGALRTMKKGLNVKTIIQGIENTLEIGISPGFNIIFGNIGETREILQKGVDFLLKYDNHIEMRTIRPVTPYPGSPLYYHAITKGLLKDCEDFYENKHSNSDLLSVNFTNMSDNEFHESLYEANKVLIKKYHCDIMKRNCEELENLYLNKDISFRGFRRT